MNRIEFISHHDFPEDPYTKELVYLCIDQKYRIAYVRKANKAGGLFWSVISLGVSQNGSKVYFEAFLQDSTFLEKDIRNFLEKRSWEVGCSAMNALLDTKINAMTMPNIPWVDPGVNPVPTFSDQECPF
jgi:hypothetical protein